ncbi:MAG: hypothetical protein JSV18_00460 [Candidatus Bathyarchaeota archaeon]|nr:MAG: hypothetical protein JSV18_00460 [Candidatus Bathyarchaeota archaeon]
MRCAKNLMLFTLMVLVTSLFAKGVEVSADESVQPVLQVEREVRIINGGILFMNDTLTLTAPQGQELTVSDFWTGLHKSFLHERFSFEMWQAGSWSPLEYSEQGISSFSGYNIELPSPTVLRDGVSLRIRSSYLFVDQVSEGTASFSALIPVYPALQYNISSCSLQVVLPMDADLEGVTTNLNYTDSLVNGEWTVTHEAEEVGSLAQQNMTISYLPGPDDEHLLDCERMERSITVRTRSLRIDDSYILTNRGNRISSFNLKLPIEASAIEVRDGVGALVFIIDEETLDATGLFIIPRYNVRRGDRWGLTVSYTVPREGHVATSGGGPTLSYPGNPFPHYVRETAAVVSSAEGGSVSLGYGATLPSERPEIETELPPESIMPTIRPIAITLIVLGAVGLIVIQRRRKPPAVVVPVEIEIPKLANFLTMHRERLSIMRQVEALEQEHEEEKISKDDYNQRTADLNRQASELSSSLRQLSRTLEEDPELEDRIRAIRKVEGELERIERDLRNLEIRLRARRISRRDFERRRKERFRRRSLALKRIEQVLATLGGD